MSLWMLVVLACSGGPDGSGGTTADGGSTVDGGSDGGGGDAGGTDAGGDAGTDAGGSDGGTALSEPQRLGELTDITAWDVALLGDIAVVAADNDGLLIVDISDPSQPQVVASVPVGQATTVDASGSICWVGTWSGRVVAVDLTDPLNPDWRSEVALAPHGVGLDIRGTEVAVASWSGNTGSDDGWGVTLIDGTDPADPDEQSSLSTPGTALDVAVGQGVVWVADGSHGLRWIDSSTLTAPVLGAAIDVGGDARGVSLNGTSATVVVAAGDAGVVTIDSVTNTIVGTVVGLEGDAEGVTVDDRSYAWVATGTGGLAVVDVSDPTDPVLRYEVSTGGTALDVDASDTVVAVAADAAGVVFYSR